MTQQRELFAVDSIFLEQQPRCGSTGNLLIRVDVSVDATVHSTVTPETVLRAFARVQHRHRVLRTVFERRSVADWLQIETNPLPIPHFTHLVAQDGDDFHRQASKLTLALLNHLWEEYEKRAGVGSGGASSPTHGEASAGPMRRYEVALGLVSASLSPASRDSAPPLNRTDDGKGHYSLLILLNHTAADMMSLKTVALELLDALFSSTTVDCASSAPSADPVARGSQSVQHQQDDVDRHYADYLPQFGPGLIRSLWKCRPEISRFNRAMTTIAKACPSSPIVNVDASLERCTIYSSRRISAEIFSALSRAANERGLTMHGPLCAGAIHAQLKQALSQDTLHLSQLKLERENMTNATAFVPVLPSIDLRRRLVLKSNDGRSAQLLSSDSVGSLSAVVTLDVPIRVSRNPADSDSNGENGNSNSNNNNNNNNNKSSSSSSSDNPTDKHIGCNTKPLSDHSDAKCRWMPVLDVDAFWATAVHVGRLQKEADVARPYLYLLSVLCRLGKMLVPSLVNKLAGTQPILIANVGKFEQKARCAGVEVEYAECLFSQVHMASSAAPYVLIIGLPDGTASVTMQAPAPFFTQDVLESQIDHFMTSLCGAADACS